MEIGNISSLGDPRVMLALMLIELGVTTVEKVKGYFTQNTDDDALLAKIHAEADARIARLG
jgi:hypothetical protein